MTWRKDPPKVFDPICGSRPFQQLEQSLTRLATVEGLGLKTALGASGQRHVLTVQAIEYQSAGLSVSSLCATVHCQVPQESCMAV